MIFWVMITIRQTGWAVSSSTTYEKLCCGSCKMAVALVSSLNELVFFDRDKKPASALELLFSH